MSEVRGVPRVSSAGKQPLSPVISSTLPQFYTFTCKSGLEGRCFFSGFISEAFPTVFLLGFSPGLSLVVGLVLYISSINDEMLNRTKDSETFFNYKYGWSFAFSAISFLLTEVPRSCHIPVTGVSHSGGWALRL